MDEISGYDGNRRSDPYRTRMTILASISTAGIIGLCGWFYSIDHDVSEAKVKYALQIPLLQKQLNDTTAELKARLDQDDVKINDLYRTLWQGNVHGK